MILLSIIAMTGHLQFLKICTSSYRVSIKISGFFSNRLVILVNGFISSVDFNIFVLYIECLYYYVLCKFSIFVYLELFMLFISQ